MFSRNDKVVILLLGIFCFAMLNYVDAASTSDSGNSSAIDKILSEVAGLLKSILQGNFTLGGLVQTVINILQALLPGLLSN